MNPPGPGRSRAQPPRCGLWLRACSDTHNVEPKGRKLEQAVTPGEWTIQTCNFTRIARNDEGSRQYRRSVDQPAPTLTGDCGAWTWESPDSVVPSRWAARPQPPQSPQVLL